MRIYDLNEIVITTGEKIQSNGFCLINESYKEVYDNYGNLILSGEKLEDYEFENCLKYLLTSRAYDEVINYEITNYEEYC